MTRNGALAPREILERDYDTFRDRLARKAGARDAAAEILNEVWLGLDGKTFAGVKNPAAYIYRMALNIAADRHRREKRWHAVEEIDGLLGLKDRQPTPEEAVSAKSESWAVMRAIGDLPGQTRDIAQAAMIGSLSNAEIAARFGISVRTVERELKRVLIHCRETLQKNNASPRRDPHAKSVIPYEGAALRGRKDRRRDT